MISPLNKPRLRHVEAQTSDRIRNYQPYELPVDPVEEEKGDEGDNQHAKRCRSPRRAPGSVCVPKRRSHDAGQKQKTDNTRLQPDTQEGVVRPERVFGESRTKLARVAEHPVAHQGSLDEKMGGIQEDPDASRGMPFDDEGVHAYRYG